MVEYETNLEWIVRKLQEGFMTYSEGIFNIQECSRMGILDERVHSRNVLVCELEQRQVRDRWSLNEEEEN